MAYNGVVLITGAAGGLGRALSKRLEQDGWRLALADRDLARLRTAFPHCPRPLLVGDVSRPEGAADISSQCLERWGRPPGAQAHCAGSVPVTPLHGTTREQYRTCLAANLDSAFYTLPGIGDPADVADVMPWLLPAVAARVTGQPQSLDGGFYAIRPLVR
jgi:NAD(P)-dependent dehydrogenase (short-subunit alcohol dehydrogenase family)